jgi:hypothetical protein
LGNCAIAGIDLPEWTIRLPSLPITERSLVISESGRTENVTRGLVDFDGAEGAIHRNERDNIHLMTYCQNIGNFFPPDFYRNIFVYDAPEVRGYGHDTLLCNIRGGDILDGHHKDYVLLPIEYYEFLVKTTGLNPVFFGQISQNSYVDELRRVFPAAKFVESTSPVIDFEVMRRSRNIAIAVSSFSWLSAWLSQADRIFMPLTGHFNPFQHPRSFLAPIRDPRYTFHLFPANYAVPVDDFRTAHDPLRGRWAPITAIELEHLVQTAPRYARSKERAIAVFDEDYYLDRYPDVQKVVAGGGLKNGLAHFISNGFSERREPLLVDRGWYTRTYPQAAVELGRGDYEDPVHHYAEVGAIQGFAPRKSIDRPFNRILPASGGTRAKFEPL